MVIGDLQKVVAKDFKYMGGEMIGCDTQLSFNERVHLTVEIPSFAFFR